MIEPAWPYLEMNTSGSTITLPTPITVGTLQITAYRFALVGNEFQLDLSVNRTGTFNDQIVIFGIDNYTYSSPWGASDGEWIGSATSAPAVTLSATSLNFGTQTVGTKANQTLKITNSGTAPLTVSSVQLSGTNAADFSIVTNGCTASVAPAASCQLSLTFDPSAVGSRTATLSITDNATGSPQTVSLTGTGSSAPTPTVFTTYLGTYGSGSQTFHGNSVVLPLRAYMPGGASQIGYLLTQLNPTAGGATEYQIIAQSDGSGGYTLRLTTGNYSSTEPAWPYLELVPSGSTVTLTTPITIGPISITAYSFALAGNEFLLDVTVTRTGTFNDQVVLFGVDGTTYSSPWGASDGSWSNP